MLELTGTEPLGNSRTSTATDHHGSLMSGGRSVGTDSGNPSSEHGLDWKVEHPSDPQCEHQAGAVPATLDIAHRVNPGL